MNAKARKIQAVIDIVKEAPGEQPVKVDRLDQCLDTVDPELCAWWFDASFDDFGVFNSDGALDIIRDAGSEPVDEDEAQDLVDYIQDTVDQMNGTDQLFLDKDDYLVPEIITNDELLSRLVYGKHHC